LRLLPDPHPQQHPRHPLLLLPLLLPHGHACYALEVAPPQRAQPMLLLLLLMLLLLLLLQPQHHHHPHHPMLLLLLLLPLLPPHARAASAFWDQS
jgi:hypothetical protein